MGRAWEDRILIVSPRLHNFPSSRAPWLEKGFYLSLLDEFTFVFHSVNTFYLWSFNPYYLGHTVFSRTTLLLRVAYPCNNRDWIYVRFSGIQSWALPFFSPLTFYFFRFVEPLILRLVSWSSVQGKLALGVAEWRVGGLLVCDVTTVLSFFSHFSSCILLIFDDHKPYLDIKLLQ